MSLIYLLPTGDLGTSLGGTDNGLFSIDGNSGVISRAGTLTAGTTYNIAYLVYDTATGLISGRKDTITATTAVAFTLGDGSGLSAAGISVTQLAAHSVAQRTTNTGGLFGKGTGAHKVTLGLSQSATVEWRTRDAEANSTTAALQDWTSLGSLSAGTQTVSVPGVAARKGWHYLDLRFNGDDTLVALGANPVGMGRVIGLSGQSLAVRLLGRMDGQTATLASLGITPGNYGTVFATYVDGQRTVVRSGWQLPADGGDYDAAGAAEYLNAEVASQGVTCATIGWMMGSQTIESFIGNTSNGNELNRALDDGGGAFEHFIWFQGHSNSAEGTSATQYSAYLDQLFAQISSHNSRSYTKLLCAIPNVTSTAWGTPDQINAVRQGAHDWAVANGALYAQPMNIDLVDGTHETMLGSQQLADYFHNLTGIDAVSGTGSSTGTSTGTASGSGAAPGVGSTAGATGGTGGLWTPANLAVKPAKWFDMQTPGATLADQASIATIQNRGTDTGDWTQANASYQPQYQANGLATGYPAAFFNANAILQSPTTLNGTQVAQFSVLAKGGPYHGWRAISLTAGDADYGNDAYASLLEGGISADYDVGMVRNSKSVAIACPQVPMLVSTGADGTNQYVRLNGGTPNTAAKSATFAPTQVSLGGYYSSGAPAGNDCWYGPISEVIILYYTPTTTDQQKIEGYLAWRWGLQTASGGVLPSGHPYYAAAPTA